MINLIRDIETILETLDGEGNHENRFYVQEFKENKWPFLKTELQALEPTYVVSLDTQKELFELMYKSYYDYDFTETKEIINKLSGIVQFFLE